MRTFPPTLLPVLLAVLALSAPAALAQDPAPPTTPTPAPTLPVNPAPVGSAFEGNGMWIWYVSQSSGGNVDKIAARARKAGIGTVFVKSSDGAGVWSQFSTRLVKALHARGLKVCGWGYVYGKSPTNEARAARTAIKRG